MVKINDEGVETGKTEDDYSDLPDFGVDKRFLQIMKSIRTYEEFLTETVSFNTDTTGRKDWDDDLKKHSRDFTQLVIIMSPADFLKRVQYHR